MNAITFHLPPEAHQKLKAVAVERGMSIDVLLQELTVSMIEEHDIEKRFRARATRGTGREAEALALLQK